MKLTQGMDIDYQRYHRYYQAIVDIQKRPHAHAYVSVAFTFLAISLFGWYAVRPTLRTILFLRREIQDKTEVNHKMEEKIATLIQAQQSYAEVEPLTPVIGQALPQVPDAVGLVSQLRNLADSSSASISSLRVSNVYVAPDASGSAQSSLARSKPQEIGLTLTAVGTFGSLQSLLSGIINMRRIVTFDSITIAPNTTQGAQASGATGPLQVVAKLTSYYAQ